MRDVNYGWLIRYLHTKGASMFSPWSMYTLSWDLFRIIPGRANCSGYWASLFLIMMMAAHAFFGYNLAMGTDSFWGLPP